jgi:hypothetical protein
MFNPFASFSLNRFTVGRFGFLRIGRPQFVTAEPVAAAATAPDEGATEQPVQAVSVHVPFRPPVRSPYAPPPRDPF